MDGTGEEVQEVTGELRAYSLKKYDDEDYEYILNLIIMTFNNEKIRPLIIWWTPTSISAIGRRR